VAQENKSQSDNASSLKPLSASDRDDPLSNSDNFISQEVPPGLERRDFLIRSAVVGAAAVMTGRFVSASERIDKAGAHDGGRVLQSWTRALEFAHDRTDAHYLRFLSACRQTTSGSTR